MILSFFNSFFLLVFLNVSAALSDKNEYHAPYKEYVFELTHSFESLDGNYRSIFLVNGSTPGPAIFGDESEWIKVKIINLLPVSVTIHFHGILQVGTPWSDGVAGLTQYPILSGNSFTYTFQLTGQHGPSWYHAHYRGYSADGIYGPIYIRPNKSYERPYSLISNEIEDIDQLYQLELTPDFLMADDQYKYSMDDIFARMVRYGIDPLCIQSIIVNGKGRVVCHDPSVFAEIAKIRSKEEPLPFYDSMGCMKIDDDGFQRDEIDSYGLEDTGYSKPCIPTKAPYHIHYTNNRKWQYMIVINTGSQFTKAFSIDDHKVYVIAVDGVFVEPISTHQVIIPVGSRVTIVYKTISDEHDQLELPFAMRFAATNTPQLIEGIAYLAYGNKDDFTVAETKRMQDIKNLSHGRRFQNLGGDLQGNDLVTVWSHQGKPFNERDKLTHRGYSDHTISLYLNRTGMVEFTMFIDGTRLPDFFELQEPLLHSIRKKSSKEINELKSPLSYDIKPGETYDIIVNNFRKVSHPIHLHGHQFHLISYNSTSNFPYQSVEEAIKGKFTTLSLENPPLIDLVFLPPGSHAVLRVKANNPGVWLIHCHNLPHLLGGMGAFLLESIDYIPEIPEYYLNQTHVSFSREFGKGISHL